jgi:hypothetical protein
VLLSGKYYIFHSNGIMRYFIYIIACLFNISAVYSLTFLDNDQDNFNKIYKTVAEKGKTKSALEYIEKKFPQELKTELDCSDMLVPFFSSNEEDSPLFDSFTEKQPKKKQENNLTFEATLHFSKLFSEHYDALEQATQKINEMVSKEDKILLLGRSPSLLGIFYQRRNDKSCSHLIEVNYSGSPDIESFREGFKDEKNYRNMVTPEGLTNMLRYLDEKELQNIKGKLFVLDIIGNGACINSFLRLTHYYYTQYLGISCPEIVFVPMNLDPNQDEENIITIGDGEHKLWQYNSSANKLTFQPDEFLAEKGFRALEVKTMPLGMDEETSSLLDNDSLMSLYSKGKKLFACQWDDAEAFKEKSAPFYDVAFQQIAQKIHSKTSMDIILNF